MKETGIVRRIDELGRVVIPKEIRKTLRIKEGDPLEIFTEKDELVFKKYSPMITISHYAEGVAESIYKLTEKPCLITDNHSVICVKGANKELLGKTISSEIDNVIQQRKKVVVGNGNKTKPMPLVEEQKSQTESQVIIPIVAGGDIYGSVILANNSSDKETVEEGVIKMVQLGAMLLASQLE